MKARLPPDEYYASLARVPTSGGALLRNKKGDFLILKQTYKDGWHIAGGMADTHETPRQAVIREVREELGLEIRWPRLFCVDFATAPPFDRLLFVFDCGILSQDEISQFILEEDEITEYTFVPFETMIELLSPKLGTRVKNSRAAFLNDTIAYLENGEPAHYE